MARHLLKEEEEERMSLQDLSWSAGRCSESPVESASVTVRTMNVSIKLDLEILLTSALNRHFFSMDTSRFRASSSVSSVDNLDYLSCQLLLTKLT